MRDFSSAYFKIERAHAHIDEFERERSRFLDTHPCKVRPCYNVQTGHTDYVVEDVDAVWPSISLIVGDAVHNLRSALDHIAAALVRANNKTPSLSTGFPICATQAAFLHKNTRAKIERMTPVDQERLRLIQPYLRNSDTILGLHRLDITDKHDLLLTHIQSLSAINYSFDETAIEAFGLPPYARKLEVPLMGHLPIPKRGEIILSEPGNLEENQNVELAFDIAFGDVPVFKGRIVGESLSQMSKQVEGIADAFRATG